MAKVGGVLPWHPEVAMSREEIDEFLSGRWLARLATIGDNGYPHVFPFWYYWDGEGIYLTPTRRRASYRDLQSNPRCSVVIDMDDRPLMGIRCNMVKAIHMTGDAEMTYSGQQVTIGAGPWRGEYPFEQAVALLTSRYLLFARDGAFGTTAESFFKMVTSPQTREAQLVKDNAERVLVKIKPKLIRAWDFSKAPIGWQS